MSNLRVLVVGASIAGPSAAYWFARAGASVTVIERFPELRKGGQNIDIRSVGVDVMRKIPGMEESVRAMKAPVRGISVVREDGRPYGTLEPSADPDDHQSLISEYEIQRGNLSKIMYDLTKNNTNINYVWDEQVTAIQQRGDGDGPVTVEFMNGYPTSMFDLVVACDGATSRTRALGLGCGLRDHVHTKNAWIGYCTAKRDFIGNSTIARAYSAPGGRTLFVGQAPSPGENHIGFMCIHPPSDTEAMIPLRNAAKQGDAAVKEYIADRYKGVGWKCPEAISAMMESDDLYANEVVQVKAPTLSRGRFVLVGDAGYAPGPTGTGTSLAMVGAYILAGEVSKSKGNLAEALKGYEETMRPIIIEKQKVSPFVPAIFAPQTTGGIMLRNWVFAFICWSKLWDLPWKYLSWLFPTTRTEKPTVPEYEWDN